MKPFKDPYCFSPLFEEALAWTCSVDPSFWERYGRHVEIDNLGDNGQVNEKRDGPAKMALRAVASIAARTGRGPESTTAVVQELHQWQHDGKVTQEAREAVEVLLTRAERDPNRPSRSAIIDQLVRAITPHLHAQASIALSNAFGGREASCPEARRILDVIDSFGRNSSASDVETVVESLGAVQPERVDWLWRGRVAFRKLNLMEGDPGRGKSLVTCEIAARLTRGQPLPGDDGLELRPADVLIVSAEDGVADTIVPRLMAASADMTRVHTTRIKDRDLERLPELVTADLPRIEEAIRKTRAKLVILDPLMAFLPGKIDSKIDHHIRRALAPLASLAEKTDAAVVVVRHWNKNTGAGRAIYRGGGSIGITGAARSVLVVAEDPDDKRRRVLASVKCNIGAPAPSLSFDIVSDYVDQAGQQIETARIVWGSETTYTADDLTAPPENPEEKSRLVEAMDFLRVVLAGGPRLATEVKAEAREVGISSKTLWVARRRLGVRARKRLGPKAPWEWWLPTPGKGEEVEAKLSLPPHEESKEPLENIESFPHDQSMKDSKDSNSSKDSKLADDSTGLDHVEPEGEADTTFDFGANVTTPSTEMPPPPPPSEIAGAKTLYEVVGYYLDHGVLDVEAIISRIAGLRDGGEALPYPWSDAALAERVPQIVTRIAERREREAYYRRLHHLPEGASP